MNIQRAQVVSMSPADAVINEFRFVEKTATGIQETSHDTDTVIGVSQSTNATGECVPVCISGIVKVRAAEAITRGQLLGPGANGKATVVATGKTGTGVALSAASAEDELVIVYFSPNVTGALSA